MKLKHYLLVRLHELEHEYSKTSNPDILEDIEELKNTIQDL